MTTVAAVPAPPPGGHDSGMSSRPAIAPAALCDKEAYPALPLTIREDYERLPPVPPDVFLRERPEARTTTLAAGSPVPP